jgi:hypothetical protein
LGRIPAIPHYAFAKECKKTEYHTIDIKEELVDFQRKHFDKSPWEAQIIQHLGEAVDIIPTLDMKFDLVLLMPIRKTILIILISFFQNEQRRDYPFIMYCGGSVRTVTPERRKHQNTIE